MINDYLIEIIDSGVLAIICYLLINRIEKRLDQIIELLKNA